MNACQILFALLRMQICGAGMSEMIRKELTPQMLKEVYSLAQQHDMAHIAGQALSELGCLCDDEISQRFKKQAMLAVFRHARIEQEHKNICKVLEEIEIPYLPLKGAVLRNYYPEPWMRTSCDIDILVKKNDLDVAADSIVQKLGYVNQGTGDHDVSLFSPNGVHFELHYTAVDQERFPQVQKVLAEIWKHASPEKPYEYRHKLSDEMFYFFHIAHMAKHVENGGCGIKPFLDTWILNHSVSSGKKGREELLERGGLLTFADAAQKLTEIWFSGAEADTLSLELEKFVLEGGVYGSMKNNVAVSQAKKGGSLQYLAYKVWLPYDVLKYNYPVLQKYKWLLPLCQIRRWFHLLFGGGMGHALRIIKTNAKVESEDRDVAKDLLKKLGL